MLHFQVVLDVREMPPYELLLKIALYDPPWPSLEVLSTYNPSKEALHGVGGDSVFCREIYKGGCGLYSVVLRTYPYGRSTSIVPVGF